MKITKLSDLEEAALPEIREKWLRVGLRTGNTDDPRPRAFAGICKAYVSAGRQAPKYWVWMDSPLRSVLACGVMAQVSAQVRDQVRDQVGAQVRNQVSDQVSNQISDQVRNQISDQVIAQISDQVRNQISDQVRNQVSDQVSNQISDQVSNQISNQISDQVIKFAYRLSWYYPGQFDGFWLAFYDVMKAHCDFGRLEGLIEVAENCSYAITFPDIVIFCARPETINRDDRNRLHCETGAAIGYADGWGVFAVHGVRVPRYVIMEPSTITVADIESEQNQEIRRVKMGRYGEARYLLDSGAKEIHRDDFGILYLKDVPGDEALVMVKVVNSTSEPDGSFKDYFLRVPPTIKRAREAVAWTFDIPETAYELECQT